MIIANIQYLEKRSAEDLLALGPTLRNGFVSTLINEVPHTLHEHNWVLLLILTLETEEALEKELNKCSIKVEKGWYERSYWKLLLQLKRSLNEETFPGLTASGIHKAWEGLKRKIHEKDLDLDTGGKKARPKDGANQRPKKDESDTKMKSETEALKPSFSDVDIDIPSPSQGVIVSDEVSDTAS